MSRRLHSVMFLWWTALFLTSPLQHSLCVHAADPRIITEDELKKHNGVKSKTIWLALLGKVFDVTVGAEYYGPDGAYHVFAGRDAPVPFVTGKFNEDEAEASWRELIDKKQLGGLQDWIDFYAGNKEEGKKYDFVGYLVGPFYNEDGTPTEENLEFYRLLHEEKIYHKEKRKREKAEREEKKRKEKEAAEAAKQQKEL